MTAPYRHAEMPPVVRKTADEQHQLESQSGTVIAQYDGEFTVPGDFWTDMVSAMQSAYSDPYDMAHDLTLLSATHGWDYIDDTGGA